MLMKNSAKFNIKLNAKDYGGYTAFHWACWFGKKKIVDVMLCNSIHLKLHLKTTCNDGKTGLQLAKDFGMTDVVNLIQSKMSRFAAL